jgi:hypothetical protein
MPFRLIIWEVSPNTVANYSNFICYIFVVPLLILTMDLRTAYAQLSQYIVRPGDNCRRIAINKYGSEEYISLIHDNNPLGPTPHRLTPGLVLWLPPKPDAVPKHVATLTFRRNQVDTFTPAQHVGTVGEQLSHGHKVSTGGDEKTFTAVVTGNAQFGVSDPTFTAIARERGQGGKVVAGIVRGVPFWVVAFDPSIKNFDNPEAFKGKRVATYTAPSTSYAVMKKVLQNNGHPVEAKIVQGAFGTLLAMLKARHADMALDIEPIVSIATAEGARVVYSPAGKLGDFAFTGLT